MSDTIRRGTAGDAAVFARIQTESWKAAFRGIIPDEELERRTDLGRVTEMYRRDLVGEIGNGYLLSVDGEPHCIAWWDDSREKDMPGYAEILCIHSLPDRWRQGHGGRMMDRLLTDIAAAGYRQVMLWVFTENERARRFYEAKGFHATDWVRPILGAEEICYERTL